MISIEDLHFANELNNNEAPFDVILFPAKLFTRDVHGLVRTGSGPVTRPNRNNRSTFLVDRFGTVQCSKRPVWNGSMF